MCLLVMCVATRTASDRTIQGCVSLVRTHVIGLMFTWFTCDFLFDFIVPCSLYVHNYFMLSGFFCPEFPSAGLSDFGK